MSLDLVRISNGLAHSLIGKNIIFLEEIGSTNAYAAELARQGASEGTVVIAGSQTAGKGRLGRSWQSPPGANLYASIILRPDIASAESARLTLAAGIAVAETMTAYCPQGVALKWPNDIQINGKKGCGILTEMHNCGGLSHVVIVGIGVNINIRRHEFGEDIREIATSLYEETGRETDRADFIIRLCGIFECWYKQFLSGDFETIRTRWLQLSKMVGKRVQVTFKDRIEQGKVIGLDADGALLLLNDQDRILEILAGDVALRADC